MSEQCGSCQDIGPDVCPCRKDDEQNKTLRDLVQRWINREDAQ